MTERIPTGPADQEAPVVADVRLREWLSVPLFVPVGLYAGIVLVGIVRGMPQPQAPAGEWSAFWVQVAWVGGVPGLLMVANSLRSLLRARWRADASGLAIGRVRPVHVPWSEIEAVFLGIPGPAAWPLRLHPVVRAWRAQALVLRLRGGRLLVFHQLGAHYVGGFALYERVLAHVPLEPASELSPEEVRRLAWVRATGLVR